METVESTDFDFFDTPRNQKSNDSNEEYERNNSRLQNSRSTEVHANLDSIESSRSNTEKRRSLSSLSECSDEGHDDDYSSDSVTSVSADDQSENANTKQSQSQRSFSSGSSPSHSYRNGKRSLKGRARKRYDSKSDENSSDYSKSKSSPSGNSSYSDTKHKTKTGYRGNKQITATKELPKYGRSQPEAEESYSSSAYSDGEETSNRILKSHSEYDKKSKSLHKNKSKRQEAWGMNDDHKSSSKKSSKERPQTAKQRKEYNRRIKRSPTNSDSEALSDSDITDVSPIESPRTHDKSNIDRCHTSLSRHGASGDGANAKALYKAIPLDDRDLENEAELDESQVEDSAGIDLKILMKAVGELEKKKRVEANSRRVMFAPMTLKRNEKENYTFDRDRTHDIDRENDRLLKEIVKQVHADRKKQYFKTPVASKSKITPSAINRERDMRRIETENINFLKRLQKVKATSTISRNNQLREYENTKLHGIPIATLHPVSRAGSRSSMMLDSYSSIGSRTRSMTSLHSVASTVRSTSSKRSSRPSSATKRIDNRPEWDDRW